MGTQCGKGYPPPDPDTTSHCNDYNATFILPNFCATAGPAGKNQRVSWCAKVGVAGEWYPKDTGGGATCQYDSCNPYRKLGFGCCRGCCGILGANTSCKRQQFEGDAITCCLKDANFSSNLLYTNGTSTTSGYDAGSGPTVANCYSDAGMKSTCAPCQRNITTYTGQVLSYSKYKCGDHGESSCRDTILDYCSGADLTDPNDLSWMERWTGTPPESEGITTQPCVYALKRNLYPSAPYQTITSINPIGTGTCSPVNSGVPLSTSGVAWSQELMDAVFAKYVENGFYIGAIPGTEGYNSFQEFLYELCCAYPIICQDGLNSTCSMYSAQRLTTNAGIAGWCGCYLPEAEYTTYVNTYQINKECTPMCNRVSTIPMVKGDGTPVSCTQNVCMIDNNTIGLANSTVNGGINFNQICGNCGADASCTCIVSNNTIEGAGASIGGGINLDNFCGSTQCSVTNPSGGDPEVLTIPCDQANDPDSAFNQQLALYNAEKAAIRRDQIITILVIIFVAIVIIIIAFFIIRPNWTDTKEKNVVLREMPVKPKPGELPKIVSMPTGSPSSTVITSGKEIGSLGLIPEPYYSANTDIGVANLPLY